MLPTDLVTCHTGIQ